MRVLQLITSFLRFKGDDSFNYEYLRRIVSKVESIDVVVPHDRKNSLGFEVIGGIKIHRFRYFFPKSFQRIAYHGGIAFNLSNSLAAKAQFPFFMLSYFFKSLRRVSGKDLIHAQWLPSGLVALALKAVTGKPVVLWVHRMVFGNFLQRKLARFILRNCDSVVFSSSYTMKKAWKIIPRRDFSVLYLGVDCSIFKPGPKPGLRKGLGIKPGQKMVLAVGKFLEKKGFPYLIEAMALVKSRDAVCVIAGYGPLEEELKHYVEKRGLQQKVLLHGQILHKGLAKWFNEADLVVVPSIIDRFGETETLGVVAVEAIACGKPVIASKVGGLVDVVKDGYNGFLVEPKNKEQLAEKIDLVLKNRALSKKLGLQARKYAVEKFSWEAIVKQTLQIYEKVLKKKR